MISTRGTSTPCSFQNAMQRGLAPDGGLYIPERIPTLPPHFWKTVADKSLKEVASDISEPYFSSEGEKEILRKVIEGALTFDAPLTPLKEDIYLLELYHGPTLAFKDFGARFMARAFAGFDQAEKGPLSILVATSGDTGSAVAHGFFGVDGTHVHLLYPSGKVSRLQEQQMTTLGGNVTALEVDGNFDDCQRLVKQAFSDAELRTQIRMSSANSINIARLLPQSFYYVYSYGRLRKQLGHDAEPVFSVPSGNFGNLTAGLIAMKSGMPVSRFLAATNANDIVPEYLETGIYQPRPSVKTISNAMDVGDPSNFERIRYLFDGADEQIRRNIWGASFDDESTRHCIRSVYEETGQIIDPHTAVGILTAQKYRETSEPGSGQPVIVLSTAHPVKFSDVVEKEIGRKIEIPERLRSCLERTKRAFPIDNTYESFRSYLTENS